ncbi:aminomethyltransferase beta-barrel domain-containing protein, partial [Falsiroseomonas oryziterrae]|uniref:aminomethyltransferase beta-barrel domain-containing protein n=1 Tax=Falsiroseomonas oryziterrae TaxID=2911368 RepID=UPI003557F7BC
AALPRPEVEVGEVNWLVAPPAAPLRVQAKLRGREAPRAALASWDADAALLRVTLDEPNVVAPGQACVLYDGDRVLAGGFIRRSVTAAGVDMAGAAA